MIIDEYLFKTMGSCISRSSRKRKRQDQQTPNLVHDTLVTSEALISPISLSSTKLLISLPQSPTSTSSSVSSFSCTNGHPRTSSYAFTSSSSSSSCSISKERSFSNEFLKSCVKDNPHIIHNYVKSCSDSTPNKRARASAKPDFTISRQRTFRREIERQSFPPSHTRSVLRSPSPSGRFSFTRMENLCKPSLIGKSTVSNPKGSLVKTENINLKPSCPRLNLARGGPYLMTRDQRCKLSRTGSKIEELCYVKEVLACKQDHDGRNITMEDIENPLIALDCFIFL